MLKSALIVLFDIADHNFMIKTTTNFHDTLYATFSVAKKAHLIVCKAFDVITICYFLLVLKCITDSNLYIVRTRKVSYYSPHN